LTLATAAGTIRRNLDPGPTLSQYPTPYPPQQPVYGGDQQPTPDQLLAPARRAGVLMIVLGVLFVFCGLCMAGVGWAMNQPDFTDSPQYADMKQVVQQFEAQTRMSMQTALLIVGIIPLAVGALLGGLGFVVRNGGFVTIILSIVLTSVLLLFLGLIIIAGGIQTATTNPSQLAGLCFYVVPFALLTLNLVWLIQAARASSQIAAARQQQQTQMWQYQQYQETYRQNAQQQGYPQVPPQQPGGMGYQYPPPAPPPAAQPPVPPPPPKDPSDGPPPPR
jgi:hypothetical protein